jgi:hypothetical protein
VGLGLRPLALTEEFRYTIADKKLKVDPVDGTPINNGNANGSNGGLSLQYKHTLSFAPLLIILTSPTQDMGSVDFENDSPHLRGRRRRGAAKRCEGEGRVRQQLSAFLLRHDTKILFVRSDHPEGNNKSSTVNGWSISTGNFRALGHAPLLGGRIGERPPRGVASLSPSRSPHPTLQCRSHPKAPTSAPTAAGAGRERPSDCASCLALS